MENLITFLVLLVLGYTIGGFLERRHYASIRQRESEIVSLPSIMLKRPISSKEPSNYKLVTGNVVISVDYFKKFIASLVNFFGGTVEAYETLLDRARREAILRMKEDAKGASEIVNIRLETSSISTNAQNSIGAIEIMAYGTAIYI